MVSVSNSPRLAPIGRRVLAACIAALGLATALVVVAAPDSPASPDAFFETSDHVQIAIGVHLPSNYEGGPLPTIFEMSGYDGASAQGGTLMKQYGPDGAPLRDDSQQVTAPWEDQYAIVHVSVRGTGCSGGEFDIFSWRSALDGKEIIENWLPDQPWWNGNVAIVGHSYGGITGFMVAATHPVGLRAVSVSGLIDDVYRGIVYPGGVQNYGFPLLWTGAIRPLYDVGGGLLPGLVRSPDEEDPGNHPDDPARRQKCATAAATKSRTTDDPVISGISPFDSDWYHDRSLLTYAADDPVTHTGIDVPIHIAGGYQDEQTGPRGPAHLWQAATNAPYRRLLLTNGDHGSVNPGTIGAAVAQDRKSFVDHFMLGTDTLPAHPVRVLWEYHHTGEGNDTLVPNGVTDAESWPLEKTKFQDWYFQADGGLVKGAPSPSVATFPYLSGSGRQSWSYQMGPTAGSEFTTPDGPDQLTFISPPMQKPLAIHGPVTATLDLATSTPDTELFVQLADEGPDGSRTYLQRGMLKASHRAINDAKTLARDRIDGKPHGRMFRPWRDHTLGTTTPVVPGEVNRYLIEIFPVGHVFRPGHQIVVLVHAPPVVDSYYVYAPERTVGINTLYVGPGHLSSIMLPVVDTPSLGAEIPCGGQEAVRCVPAP